MLLCAVFTSASQRNWVSFKHFFVQADPLSSSFQRLIICGCQRECIEHTFQKSYANSSNFLTCTRWRFFYTIVTLFKRKKNNLSPGDLHSVSVKQDPFLAGGLLNIVIFYVSRFLCRTYPSLCFWEVETCSFHYANVWVAVTVCLHSLLVSYDIFSVVVAAPDSSILPGLSLPLYFIFHLSKGQGLTIPCTFWSIYWSIFFHVNVTFKSKQYFVLFIQQNY